MFEKRILATILVLFILLGMVYALVTPVFEASDELWHYPMVRHLAEGKPLPVQVFDPAQAGPWNQEASQPPLYYYLGSALTFWIDTSDMEAVRQLNPHVDNGVITPDGNINLTVHNPANSPWRGTLLAVRIIRLFSVLLSAATVYFTYRIGKASFPNRPEIALGAAGINAFMPMFLFISGAVNNDNLAVPLSSLAILLMINQVRRAKLHVHPSHHLIHYFLLGIVLGLALLTKEGTLGLLPLAWGTVFVAATQLNSQQSTVINKQNSTIKMLGKAFGRSLLGFAVMLVPTGLISGWWYWRNIQLYGDLLGWNAFIAVLGSRAQPASLAQLWDERGGFLMSYWGLFGGVNVPMWPWIYTLLNGVLVLGVVGFIGFILNEFRSMVKAEKIQDQSIIFTLLDYVTRRFPLVISILFSAAVIYGLVQWATTTWSSQGRLVFTAVSTLNVLLAAGLAGWLPPRWSRRVLGGLVGFLAVTAALAPFLWIRSAYKPETYQQRPYQTTPVSVNYGGQIKLTGYAISVPDSTGDTVLPGQEVDVVLEWEVLEPMAQDWSVFVHLVDPVLAVPIAQRDMYLGQGLRPTSFLQPGEKLVNYYHLSIPQTAVAPADLQLNIGLYDFETGRRLNLTTGEEMALLGELNLREDRSDVPNPTAINFGKMLELSGFDIQPRRTGPGQKVELVLYWRALQPLSADYTFFAQLIDEDTTRWAANDFSPPEGTTSWTANQMKILTMPLAVSPDTPPQVYPLIIGVYTQGEVGDFHRLQLVTEDGRITQEDHLELTKIRVD